MRLDRVDLNLFVVFDTIYTERNLTRAAELLCLSQPAVSNALARLRKTLDDDLFIRTPKGMVPTPLSDSIIVKVRESLSLFGEALTDMAQFDPVQSNKTFRLSMTDFAQSLMLPELMAQLQQLAPNMTIECYYTTRKEQGRAMAAGQLDFAIDAPLYPDPQLNHQPLIESGYVCAMGQDNPALTQVLSVQQYIELKHVHISSRQQGVGQVDAALNKLGFARSIVLRVPNYLIVPQVLTGSDLVATVPVSLARQLDLSYSQLPIGVPPLALHLYWHKNADRDPASQWLRALLGGLPVLGLGNS